MACLRTEGLLTADGLATLLDAAERLVGVNPEQAQKLSQLCEYTCLSTNLFAMLPRAAYLRAQIYAIKGEFAMAQDCIETARDGYEHLGMMLEALRTNVGLMRVLGETGRYVEALNTGQSALVQIGAVADQPDALEPPDYRAIAAMLLQNCGFCYEQIGRYEEALAAYAAAEERYQTLNMTEQQAHIIENRGAVLMAQGRVHDALTAFRYAEQIYTRAGLDFYQAQTLINIGEAHLLLGNYMPALQALEQASRLFTMLGGNTVDHYILLRHMGDAYLALNLHAEALDAYGRAKTGLEAADLALHYALTLWGLGVTQIGCNQLPKARQALAAAAVILRALDNRPLLSALLLEQSRLLEVTADGAAARALAEEALALVVTSKWPIQKIYAYMRIADLVLPDLEAAEEWLTAAQQWMDTVELPLLRYRLQQRWGHLRLLQGDSTSAQCHLEQAVEEIERLRNTLVQERLRTSFLDDKRAAYQDLVQLQLLRGDQQGLEAAFAVSERAKSRALVDLIAGTIQRSLVELGDDDLSVQLQSCQAELNVIFNEMLGSGNDVNRWVGMTTLTSRARELEQTISHLHLRRLLAEKKEQQQSPSLTAPHTAYTLNAGERLLPANATLIVYHIVGDEILAFVSVQGQLHALRHLVTATEMQQLLQRLAVQWTRVRTGCSLLERHGHRLQQSAQRLLARAYTLFMAPVEALLQTVAPCASGSVRDLVIVPHRFLHQLPFHALYDGTNYLVERCAISYAPSATVYTLCQQRAIRQTGPALAVAAPDDHIPAATGEAQRVAQRLRHQVTDVRVLLNEQATLAAVTALAPRCSRLHLACHGLFRHDNPMFSAIKLHDGWLTAADVAQLHMPGALVTLSACESGRSQMMGGDESIGLVYAFLSAGAAALFVSQWLVQDEITACLMDHLYKELATGHDLAAALRAAQLKILAVHPHPHDWAPFILVGQRTKG